MGAAVVSAIGTTQAGIFGRIWRMWVRESRCVGAHGTPTRHDIAQRSFRVCAKQVPPAGARNRASAYLHDVAEHQLVTPSAQRATIAEQMLPRRAAGAANKIPKNARKIAPRRTDRGPGNMSVRRMLAGPAVARHHLWLCGTPVGFRPPCLGNIGRCLAELWPNLVRFGRTWGNFGRIWAKFGRTWSICSSRFGQIEPNLE